MLEDWKAAKGEYPDAFRNKPELFPWLSWYLDAWEDLGDSRKYDQGYPLHVPVSEILSYCELLRIEWDDVRADLLYFCSKLDEVYCGYIGSKDEEKTEFIQETRERLSEASNGDS